MERWLKRLMGKRVRRGTLKVLLGPKRSFTVGDGSGKPIAIAFDSPATLLWILTDPDLRLGEAYVDESFRVTEGSLADFLDLIESQNPAAPTLPSLAIAAARYLSRRAGQFNPRGRARKNVHHHYDLDGRLYSLFLDADRQYSCAYFEDEGMTLDDAQIAKKRHLAAKLLMNRPGLRVLDIGSGWGGLGLYLSEIAGARHITGVTLSDEQASAARARGEGRVPPTRLPRPRRELRPHRLGRHVRACRRQSLRRFLPQSRGNAERGRGGVAAFDRPLGPAVDDQRLDQEVYFPRRLYPVAVRGHARDRTLGSCRHRRRDLAAALRRDAKGMARALPRPARGDGGTL